MSKKFDLTDVSIKTAYDLFRVTIDALAENADDPCRWITARHGRCFTLKCTGREGRRIVCATGTLDADALRMQPSAEAAFDLIARTFRIVRSAYEDQRETVKAHA